jgi:hypothetical protein
MNPVPKSYLAKGKDMQTLIIARQLAKLQATVMMCVSNQARLIPLGIDGKSQPSPTAERTPEPTPSNKPSSR